jgi:hypothetical protein
MYSSLRVIGKVFIGDLSIYVNKDFKKKRSIEKKIYIASTLNGIYILALKAYNYSYEDY